MKLAKIICFLSTAALAVAGPAARGQANVNENQTTFLYVDAQLGSDSNSGSSSSPLKTIQAAVNKANINNQKSVGTKIIVDAGVYRETVNVEPVSGQTAVPLTIEAATKGTAVIAASDVLTGWSADPQYSGAYVANWTPAQSTCALPSGWPAVQEIALHTEMLFVNGGQLTQVLAYSDLKPGTFFVNTTDGTVHMWPPATVEVSAATVEVASRAKTVEVDGRSNIVLRGLVFEHAASCINTSGAVITGSSNVLIDSVEANWNSWGGLGVFSSSNVTVQNSIGSYNGGVGFLGSRDQTTLYTNNETDYNNWRGAEGTLYNWASGGAKFFQMRTTSVQGHLSYNNQAQGLWFDTDNQNITINNATLVGSYYAALQLERNEGPIMLENSHLCSSGVGANILTTESLTVNNNVFYNNGATNKYQAQFYLAGTAGGINITNWQTGQVYDLVTKGTVMSGNAFIDAVPGQFVFGTYLSGADWTDFASTLKSGNNTWYDPATTSAFHIVNGKNVDLSGWQTATGADYNSNWSAPGTSPASACAAPSAAYPDFNVTVDNSAYTMSSGKVTATVRVLSFNFGAVNLSMSGLPAGVTASFSNPSLTSGYSILTLTASSTSAAQTVPVTLWAISGDRVHAATFNLTVNANPAVIGTTTSLGSSASTVTENTPVTLTATVQQASGTTKPTGTVTFYNGATSLGTASLSSGSTTLTTSALPAGSDSLTAAYAGTSTFNASTSGSVYVTVNANVTGSTTSLAASAATITQNSPVTLTATVKPNSGTATPAGAVTFYDGATSLGSATLANGIANLSTSALPVGADSLTAVYSGTSSFSASTSNAVSITVNAAVVSTATKLTSSSSSITQNTAVILTATVQQAGGTTIPTGTVTFYNGAVWLGSASLSSGTASISTSALPVGTDPVTAAYSGGVAFNASSSGIVSITVTPPAPTVVKTSTTIAASAISITQNSPLTLVATVTPASGTTAPTGSVNFYSGSTLIGTASLVVGVATFTTSTLPVGSDTLSATYAGTSTFSSSASSAIAITVNPVAMNTLTTLAASSTSVGQNSPVTFSVTVKPTSSTAVPTGSVNFYNGSALIGTAALSAGAASLTTSALPTGTDNITANYAGGGNFNASISGAVAITVNAAVVGTSTALTASSDSIAENSPVTLSAIVKQASGTTAPSGAVNFFNGATKIGTAAISGGNATLTTSSLPVGIASVTASYAGSSAFSGSTSNSVTININAASVETTATLAASSTNITQDLAVTFTATIKAAGGTASPSGPVTFYDGSQSIGIGTLSSGNATLATSSLPAGPHSITAIYGGSGAFLQSTSNVVDVTVNLAPVTAPIGVSTNTIVSSSASQADQGFTICLTATVVALSGSASPTGIVDFKIGQTKIGSASLAGGKAYLTTAALPAGTDVVMATYEGASPFSSSNSSAITLKILGPDFTFEATPAAVSTTPGQSVNVSLLITPENGFNQTPDLACSGLPTGSTCFFGSPVKQPDGTSTVKMTIQTAATQTASSHSSGGSRAPLALAFLPLVLWISSKRRKEFSRLVSLPILFLAIVIAGGSVIGCGGKSSLSSTDPTSAASGPINVIVNAHTGSGISHTTTVLLTLM